MIPYGLRVRLATTMQRGIRRWTGPVTRQLPDGLPFFVAADVHDPAPFGLGVATIMAAVPFRPGERVLDLGTGSGVWALLAARSGTQVVATDLPTVPLGPLSTLAGERGLALEVRQGDLFAPVAGQRFDVVLCNPPFHDGEPKAGEAAWVGGDVVRRLLDVLPAHLTPEGRAYLVLPRAEQRRYATELAPYRQTRVAETWLPILGRIAVIELRPGGNGVRVASAPACAWRRLAELGETRSCELLALDGHLDLDRLDQAMAHTVALHPMLRVRAVPGGWEVGAAPLRFRRETVTTVLTREALLAATWSDGDPDEADATVFTDPERHWLRFRVPHDRTDARAGAQVMQDLADAYTALSAGRAPALRGDAAPWDPARLIALSPRDLLRAVVRIGRDLLAPAAWIVPPTQRRGTPRVAVYDTAADTMPRLKARAKAEGTTAHAWLTLSAARAFGVSRLLDLVTLRPLTTRPVDARADVLVAPWVQSWPADADTAGALAVIAARVHDIKHGGARAECGRLTLYDALAGLVPTAAAAQAVFRWIVKADLFVTNPGPVHVPLERFGDVSVRDFVNYPVLVPPGRAGLVFTTFRDRLRIIALWDDAAFPDGVTAQVRTMFANAGITDAAAP